MIKKYEFEKIRLHAILSFIFMSLMYIGLSSIYTPLPLHVPKYISFPFIFKNFILLAILNLIRYRYFNTIKYSQDWLFLLYGYFDLFTVSFYFGIPTLDQGGKIVILFVLIVASIYRGRKLGLILTLLWFPMKMASNFVFMHLLKPSGSPDFSRMILSEEIIDALYFQVLLFILVFITEAIYRQIADRERENKHLLRKSEQHYKELNSAHKQIEAKNASLKRANTDLENVNKQLTNTIAELFTLQQVSKAIISLLDVHELMNYVNDITLGVLGVKYSTIILFNEKNSKLEVHTTNVTDEKAYETLCNNINYSKLLNILEGEATIWDNNVDSKKFTFTEEENVKSFMCAPIISKSKKFGLILVEQNFENAFDIDKVNLLTVIAQQVGLAMENADLYRKTHEMAITDNLTGVYNKMYFHERLEAEIANSKIEHAEFTLAMFDIDHFKSFNDTHGHLFGDKVLKTIAEVMSHSIRSQDIMARFGGEEFIILFPHTSLREACKIVERLRKKIANTSIKNDSVYTSITASFGIAAFPENASNALELVKSVDDALYRAKDSGRNCIKVSPKKIS